MPAKGRTSVPEYAAKCMFSQEAKKPSPFFKTTTTLPKAPFTPLKISGGFYKSAAKADAMLIIRMLANQSAKNGNYCEFLEHLNREISLKNGDFDAETMARDALMSRWLNNEETK
ncbi:MAG: hypothetical protein LBF66_02620 [Holosporales bacterium]|jgi:hypothetical protein|nr:hypothetical protein [Holosporales bacterium]